MPRAALGEAAGASESVGPTAFRVPGASPDILGACPRRWKPQKSPNLLARSEGFEPRPPDSKTDIRFIARKHLASHNIIFHGVLWAFVAPCRGHCQIAPDMLEVLPERYPTGIRQKWRGSLSALSKP
jgi:hypothetical protein